MSAARERKDAARNLGIALTVDYRRMIDATGPEAITAAAVILGQHFNDNIEFICWVLKEYGGVDQMPFRRLPKPANGTPPLTGQDNS